MPHLPRVLAWVAVLAATVLLVRAVTLIFFPLTVSEPTTSSIGEIFVRRLAVAGVAGVVAVLVFLRTRHAKAVV